MGSEDASQAAAKLGDDRVLGGFQRPFRRLIEPGDRDLGSSFDRFGQAASRSKAVARGARVLFRVTDDAGAAVGSWSIELTAGKHKVIPGAVERPDLEVVVGEKTWRQLAEGKLSPMMAFATGEMRVRGGIRLAAQLAEHVHSE
jgi:hypothetical protein